MGYQKPSCDEEFNHNILIDANNIQFDDFVGTLTDNKVMAGTNEESYNDEDDSEISETNLIMIKISDLLLPIAKTTNHINGQSVEHDLFCYQKSNESVKLMILVLNRKEYKHLIWVW